MDIGNIKRNFNKKLVIVTPVYNTEKYLHQFFKSVLSQSFTDFDLFVVNDGSVDGSEEIIREYEEKDSRVHYYKKDNGGVSSARNYALEKINESKGRYEYIYFCDSDDMLGDHCLKKNIEAITQIEGDYAVFSVGYLSRSGLKHHKKRYIYNKIMSHEDIVRQYFRLGWKWRKDACSEAFLNNKIFRMEHVRKYRFDETLKRSEDFAFFLDILPCLKKGVIVPAAMYIYRRRKSSLTNTVVNDTDLIVCKSIYNNISVRTPLEKLAINHKLLRAYYITASALFSKGYKNEAYKLIKEVCSLDISDINVFDLKILLLAYSPKVFFEAFMRIRDRKNDRSKIVSTYFD